MSSNGPEIRLEITGDSAGADAAVDSTVGKVEAGTAAIAEGSAKAAGAVKDLDAMIAVVNGRLTTMATAAAQGLGPVPVLVQAVTNGVEALQQQIVRTQAAGAPVSPAAIETINRANAALAALNTTAKETAPAVVKAKEELSKFDQAMLAFSRGSLAGTARGIAILSGGLFEVLIPLFLVEAAFQLLPRVFKAAEETGTFLGETLAKLSGGLVEESKSAEAANAQLAKLDQGHKAAADAAALHQQAEWAVNAGLIQETANEKLLLVQEMARQAALHGTLDVTDEYIKKLGEFGIKVKEVYLDGKGIEQAFFSEYERLVKVVGIPAAEEWVKEQEKLVQKLLENARITGTEVLPQFKELADRVGILPKVYADAEAAIGKATEKLRGIGEQLAHNAAELKAHIATMEEHRKKQIEVADEEFAAVEKAITNEMRLLNDAHTKRLIDERSYQEAFNKLQELEVDARRTHQAQIDKINAEATKKEQDYTAAQTLNHEKTMEQFFEEASRRADLEFARAREEEEDIRRTGEAAARHEKYVSQMKTLDDEIIQRAVAIQLANVEAAKNSSIAWEALLGPLGRVLDKLTDIAVKLTELDPVTGAEAGGGPSGGGGGGGF